MLDRTLFARVGRALYGGAFIAPLARDLGVGERVAQRWSAGAMWPPVGVWQELAQMLEQRGGVPTTSSAASFVPACSASNSMNGVGHEPPLEAARPDAAADR